MSDKFDYATVVDDPVENCILAELEELRKQNIRLKSYIEKSGYWAELKKIQEWKPFDFLHYFCNLYNKKYKKEYKVMGNIVRAYQKIEEFMTQHNIKNKEYKDFIDLAFTRYFTESFIPSIGTVCAPSFFSKVTNRRIAYAYDTDFSSSGSKMSKEVDEFDTYVNSEEEEFGDLDSKLYESELEILADE